ncbi:hypothetical protein [Actinoalloteichus fjordicus]|uniref:SWIM-type domain-containing protein n=1 Tax=Actinoalloteichus fjordicus TaxID=1612552 RepID=A0AAC9LFV4_9PSEU|nr:hypothetical protein [Actinoalloteichus fjordicus]APU16007.1 hypothetical protein UA74_19910 [Actinoalloteichus fjordicus]
MTRSDLLALSTEALAALANRGLVKRAAKDLDAGVVPAVTLDADGTVHGRFPDGVGTALPGGVGLDGARCDCASISICRHRIGLVLAYQRQAGAGDDGATGAEPTGAGVAAAGSAGHGGATTDVASEVGVLTAQAVPDAPTATEGPTAGGDAREQPASPGSTTSGDPRAREDPGDPVAGDADPAGSVSATTAPRRAQWSPGDFEDEAVRELIGSRAMTTARRLHRAGYSARVRRSTESDPVARVELASCTVRFLVPGEPAYVHTDAAGADRGEFIALAVWAFRAADERGLTEDDVRLDVGDRADTTTSGIEPALALADRLLLDGAMHAGPASIAELRRAAATLQSRNLHWPAATLSELVEQLTAYADRSAHHRSLRVAELLVELHARHRAVVNGGASPRSRVLGTDEPAKTPLRRVRLTSLGARVTGTAADRTVEVFLAHVDTGTVLVLRRRYEVAEGEELTGHDLAPRRVARASLRALAAAEIVSETASRTAGRLLHIADGRVARTTVLPLGTAWNRLPDPLVIDDFAAAARAREDLPPRLIRPRVEAEDVHVVRVARVVEIGYHPGDQRLDAVIADAAGTPMTVSAAYRTSAPGALDALAEALRRQDGDDLSISGLLTRVRGGLVLEPIAVLVGPDVVLPDFAPGDGGSALATAIHTRPAPLDSALETALLVLAEAAHRGLRHPTPGLRRRIEDAATGLNRVGLRTGGALTAEFATSLAAEDLVARAESWLAAHLRLLVTTEIR